MPDGTRPDLGNGMQVEPAPLRSLDGAQPPQGGDHAAAMDLPPISRRVIVILAAALALLFIAMFFIGWGPHTRKLSAAATDAAETSTTKPAVDVISPKVSNQDEQLLLPADVRPNQMTAIFARTSGYLKPLPPGIDIGARVESGQLIAEIASPEIDAQLDQARASLDQANVASVRAEQEFALNQSTLTRYETAFHDHAIADQDLDERRTQQSVGASAMKAAQANVAAAQAAVNRLADLQAFEKISAPFSGVLTTRGYDAGALISAGDGTGKELFRIEQTDVLRVAVNIPQNSATDIRLGQAAELLVRNFPGRTFAGKVARWSGAIDSSTRTMRVEVDVPNADGQLLPGMYGQVQFHIHHDKPALIVPTSALVFGSDGMRIGVVDGGHARFRLVTLGRDFGIEVEVASGLAATDQVINNPGALKDDSEVTVRKHADPSQK